MIKLSEICVTAIGIIAGCWLGCGSVPAARAADKAAESASPEADRIAELIASLGDANRETRDKAHEGLVKIGRPSIGPLRAALTDADPARRAAARRCLNAIQGPVIESATKKLVAAGFLIAKNPSTGAMDIASVHDQAGITDDKVSSLAELTGLESISLKNTSVGDGTLKAVGGLDQVRWLTLESDRGFSAEAFANLQGMRKLERLTLMGKYPVAGLSHLTQLPQLTQLTLHGALTQPELELIGGWKNLQHLELFDSGLTDAQVDVLAGMKSLRSLSINRSGVTGKTLSKLGELPNLAFLTLIGTKLTDATLPEVMRCENLVSLNVGEAPITLAAARKLTALKKLKRLTLHDTAIRETEREELRKLLPGVLIYY